jgi:hypothetical protein
MPLLKKSWYESPDERLADLEIVRAIAEVAPGLAHPQAEPRSASVGRHALEAND